MLIIASPLLVYTQLIDNRDLPPELLRVKPPFEATKRSEITNKSDRIYIILDNADDIKIQDFDDTKTSEIIMLGTVRVRFDGNFLKTEKLVVTMRNSSVIGVAAFGNIEFTFAGVKYLADSMYYQPDMERGVMYNVRSILGTGLVSLDDMPWFFRAEKVTIQSSSRFVMENVMLTTSDTRFDHFGAKVKKLWYLQGKVALVLGLEYITGQASFAWLPVFLKIDGANGIYTSFGSEKRIGYYFINNYFLESKIGKFDFGFDIYERLGQYFKMEYEAPSVGFLQDLQFRLDLANDIRIVKNGDLYSQWISPQTQPGSSGEFQRMSQFAWYYKIDTTFGTNGISVNLHFEDLNDPFFLKKYSYRSRFDDAESIDFSELLNPSLNSWFGYQGDADPGSDGYNTINRGFSINADNFSLSASWELLRVTRPDKTNQFLNEYYKYELRSLTLPEMSYNFGSLDLLDSKYATKATVTVRDSRGRKRTIPIQRLAAYKKKLNRITNRSISRKIILQRNGRFVTNYITNFKPVTITNIETNDYEWVSIRSSATARAQFRAQQTFGTNDTSTTTDIEILSNTNWTTIADLYRHQEDGSLDLNIGFLDNIITINNALAINYIDQWSSFANDYENNLRSSGMKMDYNVGAQINPEYIWDEEEWFRTSIGIDTSVQYSYPLYYLLRLQTDFLKESSFSWKNSLFADFMQWQRETLLRFELGFDWDMKYRIPTEDQAKALEKDENDIFINNKIYDRLTLKAKTQIFWLSIGAETTLDILKTDTNAGPLFSADNYINRFIGGYPKLFVEFTPNSKYHYIPKLVYRYNLFEKSSNVIDPFTGKSTTTRIDKSFDLQFLWDVRIKNYQIPSLYPFIYELSEFGFVVDYFHDFINIRRSRLGITFVIGIKFTKYLTLRFSSQMLNEKIYLYYNGVYNGENILAPGETPKNFWEDLGDGLKIWDQEALKRSSFKLQTLNFELIHDLQTWDMRIIFNLGRRTDEVKQIAFWEPYIGIAFTMKGSNAADIFPEFQKRFVPAEYQ